MNKTSDTTFQKKSQILNTPNNNILKNASYSGNKIIQHTIDNDNDNHIASDEFLNSIQSPVDKSKKIQELQRLKSICYPQKFHKTKAQWALLNESGNVSKTNPGSINVYPDEDVNQTIGYFGSMENQEDDDAYVKDYNNNEMSFNCDEDLLSIIQKPTPNSNIAKNQCGMIPKHSNKSRLQSNFIKNNFIGKSTINPQNNESPLSISLLNDSNSGERHHCSNINTLENGGVALRKNRSHDSEKNCKHAIIDDSVSKYKEEMIKSNNNINYNQIKFLELKKDYANKSPDNKCYLGINPDNLLKMFSKTPEKSSIREWNTDELLNMKDCKTQFSKVNFWNCAYYLVKNMKVFVDKLLISLKDLCLTKTLENNIQWLVKKYALKLDQLCNEWQENLQISNDQEFSVNIKNILNILTNCFEDILDQYSELLNKLKNFNSSQFSQLTNKGLLSTFHHIINQDYTFNIQHIFIKLCESIAQFRTSSAIIRLILIMKHKVHQYKVIIFQSLRVNSIICKKNEKLRNIAIGFMKIEACHKIKRDISTMNYMNKWRMICFKADIKNNITYHILYKNLITDLLCGLHDEAQCFKALYTSLRSIININNIQILLFDKVHRILYGYNHSCMCINTTNISNKRNQYEYDNLLSSPSNNVCICNKPNKTNKITDDNEINHLKGPKIDPQNQNYYKDSIHPDINTKQRYEISLEDDSIVKYCILNKEIINMVIPIETPTLITTSAINNVAMTMLNKSIDHKSKFIYYPLCNRSKEVIGVIRIFPDENELIDSDISNKLTRFAEILVPILDKIIPLQKRLELSLANNDCILANQENLYKTIVVNGLKILWNTINPSTMLSNFTGMLIKNLKLDKITIYTPNNDGQFYELYSENSSLDPIKLKEDVNIPFNNIKIDVKEKQKTKIKLNEEVLKKILASNKNMQKYTKCTNNESLVYLPVTDPITQQVLAILEIQHKRQHHNYHHHQLQEQEGSSLLPEFLIDYLPNLLMNILNLMQLASKTHFELDFKTLKNEYLDLQNLNKSLQNKYNQYRLLYDINCKLKSINSFEEIVILFNETFSNSYIKPEYAAFFFLNSQNTSYFTYNYLKPYIAQTFTNNTIQNTTQSKKISSTERLSFDQNSTLFILNKEESWLGKLFEVMNANQTLNINEEDGSIYNNSLINQNKTNDNIENDCVLTSFPLGNYLATNSEISLSLRNQNISGPNEGNEFSSRSSNDFTVRSKVAQLKKKIIKSLLIIPIVFNDKAIAYIVLGNGTSSSLYTKFTTEDENFVKNIANSFQSFFIDQYMLNDSTMNLTRILNKSKMKSSKIKAYKTLLFDNLKSEYTLYKKHHNIQSLIYFIEINIMKLVKAQRVRILLYNPGKNTLYYYTKITNIHSIEIMPQSVLNSIGGMCIAKNEIFIYPQMQTFTLDEINSISEISIKTDNNSLLSFRSNNNHNSNSSIHEPKNFPNYILGKSKQHSTFMWDFLSNKGNKENTPNFVNKNDSQNFFAGTISPWMQNESSYSLNKSNKNYQISSYNVQPFEKTINYNHLVDSYPINFNNDEPDLSTHNEIKIASFVCFPLIDENNKVLGIIQIFNKHENHQNFTKKDINKINGINEIILPKLKKLLENPLGIYSIGVLKSCKKLSKISKNYIRKLKTCIFQNLRNYNLKKINNEKLTISIIAGYDILKNFKKKQMAISFMNLKVKSNSLIILNHVNNSNLIQNTRLKRQTSTRLLINILSNYQIRKSLDVFNRLRRWCYINSMKKSINHLESQTNFKLRKITMFNIITNMSKKLKSSVFTALKQHEKHSLNRQLINKTHRLIAFKNIQNIMKNKSRNHIQYGFNNLKLITTTSKLLNTKSLMIREIKLINELYFEMLGNSHHHQNIKNLFKKLYNLLNNIYPQNILYINIGILDISQTKLVYYDPYQESIHHQNIIKNQATNIHKILENDIMMITDSRSVIDSRIVKGPHLLYYTIKSSEKAYPWSNHNTINIIIEIIANKKIENPLGQESRVILNNIIDAVFKKNILQFKNIDRIYKKFQFNHKHYILTHWAKQNLSLKKMMSDKDNLIKQSQIDTLKNSYKICQQQLQNYELKLKNFDEEIKSKDELILDFKNIILQFTSSIYPNIQAKEQTLLEKKTKTKHLSISLFHSISQLIKFRHKTLRESFLTWKISAINLKVTKNNFSKIIQTNHKHNVVRFNAGFTIIHLINNKIIKKNLNNAFKILLNYKNPSSSFLNKSANLRNSVLQSLNDSMNKVERPSFSSSSLKKYAPHGDQQVNHSKSPIILNKPSDNSSKILYHKRENINTDSNQTELTEPTILTPIQSKQHAESLSSYKKSFPISLETSENIKNIANSLHSQQQKPNKSNSQNHYQMASPSENSFSLLNDNNYPTSSSFISKSHLDTTALIFGQSKKRNGSQDSTTTNEKQMYVTFQAQDNNTSTNLTNFQTNSSFNEAQSMTKEAQSNTRETKQLLNLSNFAKSLNMKKSIISTITHGGIDNPNGTRYSKFSQEEEDNSFSGSISNSSLISRGSTHHLNQHQPNEYAKCPQKRNLLQFKPNQSSTLVTTEERPTSIASNSSTIIKFSSNASNISDKTKRFLEEMDMNRFSNSVIPRTKIRSSHFENINTIDHLNQSENIILTKGDNNQNKNRDDLNYSLFDNKGEDNDNRYSVYKNILNYPRRQ